MVESYFRSGLDRTLGLYEVKAPRIYGKSTHESDKFLSLARSPLHSGSYSWKT
jgi:hypothetical protein